MIAVPGTFHNGIVVLDKDYISTLPVKVIVTFLEEITSPAEKELLLADFSFAKSQKNLEEYKGSLSETVIDERRIEL